MLSTRLRRPSSTRRHAGGPLQGTPRDRGRRAPGPGNHRADRRPRPRRPLMCVRFGPLVLPRRVAARSRTDRPRIHRCRRGGRCRGARLRQGRLRHRALHLLRRYVRALPRGGHVAVVGDGAVGLCGVLAAQRLGAARIIALSRNPSRQALAREFGATDILAERGDAAINAVLEMTDGVGADAALECVGTGQSVATALAITRPGSMVGIVGVPHGVDASIAVTIVFRNVGLRGGVAPARAYIPELLADVLEGRINPGRVFDFETDLDHVAEAYQAMDERRAIKSLLRIGAKETRR